VESLRELIANNFSNVEKAAAPLYSYARSLPPHNDPREAADSEIQRYEILLSLFARPLEIICNIFFRAIELAEYADVSENLSACFFRMKEKGFIYDAELWMNMREDSELAFKKIDRINMAEVAVRIIGSYLPELSSFQERAKALLR
jgi:hypothetical protein